MNQPHEQRGLFPAVFDEQIFVGPEEGNEAYFGLNVLRGLVLDALPGRPFRAENGVVVVRRCRRSLVLQAVV